MPLITLIESGKPYPHGLGTNDRRDLSRYLSELWQTPAFLRARVRSPRQQLLHISHRAIQAGGFVGFLWWRDWQIQIFPKVFASHDTAALVFQHLRWYLSLLPNKDFLMSDIPLQSPRTLSEAYTAQIRATLAALTHYPPKAHTGIDFEQYAHRQLPRATWYKLPHKTPQDTHTDLLQFLSQVFSPWLELQGQAIAQLPPPKLAHNAPIAPPLSQLRLSTQAAQLYDMAVRWTQIPESLRGKFWLLPMARVYERFLTALASKYFDGLGLAAQINRTLATNAQGKPLMRLRPDWYLPHSHSVVDLKYKLLPQKAIHTSLSRKDLYQALTYAQCFHAKNTALIYPASMDDDFAAQEMHLNTTLKRSLWIFRLPIAAHNIATLESNLRAHLSQMFAALAQ